MPPTIGVSRNRDTKDAGERAELQFELGKDLRQVVLSANADGIDLLRRGHPSMAFDSLKYAEAVLVANPELSAAEPDLFGITCSNLGCYYKKVGLPRVALQYVERAMQVEHALGNDAQQDTCALATTKLNACAALSGVGQHEEAEKLAIEAAYMLAHHEAESPTQEESALLAVACNNLGAEREHLGNWAAAAMAYRQGSEAARKALGPRSPLARTLAERCSEALEKAGRHPAVPTRPPLRRPQGFRRAGTRGHRLRGATNNKTRASSAPGTSLDSRPGRGIMEVNTVYATSPMTTVGPSMNDAPSLLDIGVGSSLAAMNASVGRFLGGHQEEDDRDEFHNNFLPELPSSASRAPTYTEGISPVQAGCGRALVSRHSVPDEPFVTQSRVATNTSLGSVRRRNSVHQTPSA